MEKTISEQSAKFLGILQQACLDALNQKADEIFDKEGIERAYFQFKITLEMKNLDSNFEKPLQIHTMVSEEKGNSF